MRSHGGSHLGLGRHVDDHEIQHILSSRVNRVALPSESNRMTHLLQQLFDRRSWGGKGKA